MKQRIITAVIGLGVFFTVFFGYNTPVFTIVLTIISLIAVHELLLAAKCTKNIPFTVVIMIMSVIPFITPIRDIDGNSQALFTVICLIAYPLLIVVSLVMMLMSKGKIGFKQLIFSYLTAIIVPVLFFMIRLIGFEMDLFRGIYCTLLVFCCSWGADSGAYFAGRFLGKKKLAPKISPNKTVEGVYGGVASSIFFVALLTAIFYFIMVANGQTIQLNYFALAFVAIIGSLVGVVGDLSASLIKRKCQIKDFGVIFPGHGGIMDRFDSVLFVIPFIYLVTRFMALS